MSILLELNNISKSFPGVKALSDVSMDLYPGEVHALLGENGAGKSTLMKILSGVYKMDVGEIKKNGTRVHINTTHDAQVQGINIVYQEFNLCTHLTVAQNIFLAREQTHKYFSGLLNDRKQNEEARKIMEMLHQNISPTEKISNLSVGEQQMVEIAKALSVDCDVLVMDEPTAALTEKEIDNLFEVIKKLKQQGKGIIYISHRLHELDFIADRVTVLRDGQKVETLVYKDTNVEQLINLMVGRDMSHLFPERNLEVDQEVIFEVKNLSEKHVLHDISFQLRKGELLGIAGLMGAGRTEMARAIFGADHRSAGRFFVHGKEVFIKTPRDAVKAGIGYLTEDRKKDGLLLNLAVIDNAVLACVREFSKYYCIDKEKMKKNTTDYVDKLSIKTPSIDKRISELSGGNQQKVIIARWLAKHCNVLIFDEPTRGIDVGAKYEIYEILNQLLQMGVGVIMISSELPELLGMCTRILVMNSGYISGECQGKDVAQEDVMHLATKNMKA